jgi:hypothetical protein
MRALKTLEEVAGNLREIASAEKGEISAEEAGILLTKLGLWKPFNPICECGLPQGNHRC